MLVVWDRLLISAVNLAILIGDSLVAGKALSSSEFELDSPGDKDRDTEGIQDWISWVEDVFGSSKGVGLVAFISLLIDSDMLFHS